jgi:hypothetical protein
MLRVRHGTSCQAEDQLIIHLAGLLAKDCAKGAGERSARHLARNDAPNDACCLCSLAVHVAAKLYLPWCAREAEACRRRLRGVCPACLKFLPPGSLATFNNSYASPRPGEVICATQAVRCDHDTKRKTKLHPPLSHFVPTMD